MQAGKRYVIQMKMKRKLRQQDKKKDFKIKTITRDKRHYIKIKRSTKQDNITLYKSMYPTQQHLNIKQKLIDIMEGIGTVIITGGDFNTPLKSMDRSFRHKNKKVGSK